MIKKKLPFVLVFFYLGTLVSSLLVHGEDQTTPNILLRQALSSNRKSRSESIKLRATIGRLVTENNNLKDQLTESRREIGSLRQEIRDDAESVTTIITGLDDSKSTTTSIRKTLATQETTLKEASNSLTKLEWESRLLKFGGSILLGAVVVGGLVLLVGGK